MRIQEKMVWKGKQKMLGYMETESLAEYLAGATQ